jgi:hypothetical protein
MLTVKALSPDKTVMGKADGINGPAGYTVLCAIKASARGRPGVLGRVELHMETTW